MSNKKIDEEKLERVLKNVDAIAAMAGGQITDEVILEIEKKRILGQISTEEANKQIVKRIHLMCLKEEAEKLHKEIYGY